MLSNNKEYDSLLRFSGIEFAKALMKKTGYDVGIEQCAFQNVSTSRLKGCRLNMSILTTANYCIDFKFHAGLISKKIMARNYLYATDLFGQLLIPIKTHIISLDRLKRKPPALEVMPGQIFNPDVTYFADFDGKDILNKISNKIDIGEKLSEMDIYDLGLIPFYNVEKSRKETLIEMIDKVNDFNLTKEDEYIVNCMQIYSVNAFFNKEMQKKLICKIKKIGTYIANFEENIRKEAVNETMTEVASKMKSCGVDSDFIFKSTGIRL